MRLINLHLKEQFSKPPLPLRNKSVGEYSNFSLALSQKNTWELQFSCYTIPWDLRLRNFNGYSQVLSRLQITLIQRKKLPW